MVKASRAAGSIIIPPPPAPASPPADADDRLTPAAAAYFVATSSRYALASFSEPKRAAGSIVRASNSTPSCLPDAKPNLVSRCLRTAVILNPPGILDDTKRAMREEDCLPSWPLNVDCMAAPSSSSGVSSGFSGVEPNSLPRSPRISFCSVDLPPTRSLIALLSGMSAKGFFSFCATSVRRMSTACTGASATAAAGPALAGGGADTAVGAADGVGPLEEAGAADVAGVASSSTGSTS